MSAARGLLRNLLANWFGYGANLVVMFFLSPFVVRVLGKTEYGIWNLLVTLTGSMGLLDLGIRASTERYIILYTGQERSDLVNRTVRTSLGFFSLVGVVVLALGVLLGVLMPGLFRDVPSDYQVLIRWLLPLLAANIWLTALTTTFSSVLVAHDRYDLMQAVNLIVLVLRTGGTVAVLLARGGVAGLACIVVASHVLASLGNYALARRVFPNLQAWPPALDRRPLIELTSYGAAAFVAAIAYRVIHQTDILVVGALIGVPLVTVYAVGAMLPEYIWGFVDQVCRTFFPPLQRAVARNDPAEAHRLYLRQARTGLLAGLPVYVGILVFGGRFLRLWMGNSGLSENDLDCAVLVMCVLSGARLVFLLGMGAAPLLSAIGYIRFNAVIGVVEALANLGLSLWFVLAVRAGPGGVAAGTLVSMVLVRGVTHPWYACKKAHLDQRLFLRRTVLPGLLAGGLLWGWCLALRWVWPAGGWVTLALQAAAALAGYAPVGLLLLADAPDRRRLLRLAGLGARPGRDA